MNAAALYLFCFAAARTLPALDDLNAAGNAAILSVVLDNVAAVVSEVPREDFEGADAEQRLQDLAWVGPRALRHGEVISEIMRASPVLPARFGTLFSSEEALLDFMIKNHDAIEEFLESVRGSEEWAVKGVFSRAEARERLFADLLAGQAEDLAAKPAGVRYFKEQQLRATVEKQIGAWLKDVCGKVAHELNSCAHDSVRRPVSSLSSVGSEDGETVVNWAFLVGSDRVAGFLSAVEGANSELHDRGLVFQASGPWPPYSFGPALASEAEQ